MTQICKMPEAVRSSTYYNSAIVFVNGALLHQSAAALQPATTVNPLVLPCIIMDANRNAVTLMVYESTCYKMHVLGLFLWTIIESTNQLPLTSRPLKMKHRHTWDGH